VTRNVFVEDLKMAAGESSERVDLAKKLDKDLDEHMEDMLLKNKNYKYQDGLKAENIDEQLRLIPAFSKEAPTQEDIDASPALQALQALKYEHDNPHESALALKEDGNYHFAKKHYKKAITAYTEGLKEKHDDQTLIAVFYTNRAAANFYLGNNGSALKDAIWALKHKEDHMKAYVRATIACFDLEKYDDCLSYCEKGLKFDPKDKKLIEMKKKCTHEKKQKERDARKKQIKEMKDLTERNNLVAQIESRRMRVEYLGEVRTNRESVENLLHKTTAAHSGKIYIDNEKTLHWPAYFLYPEYNQSDFIEDFPENVTFNDQLEHIFGQPAEWDRNRHYTKDQVKVYFEDKKNERLINIPPKLTLRQVLSDSRFVLRGGCPAFICISLTSSYHTQTFERNKPQEF